MAVWLHFMMASTAWATDANSSRPDDDRSDLSGNMRTAVGHTSFCRNISMSWSSVRLGGVLKKCRICRGERNVWAGGRSELGLGVCSPCLAAGCDFCWPGPVTGSDCSLSRCTLWSWPSGLEDCTGWSPPTGSSAWRIYKEAKLTFSFFLGPMGRHGPAAKMWKAYAIWSLPLLPIGMLFRCWTQRSTATESPICTMAVPSFVFRNFICKGGKNFRINLDSRHHTAYPGHVAVKTDQIEELVGVGCRIV